MNDFKSLPKGLPDPVNSFEIEVIGNLTKQKYNGNFTCAIPNLRMQSKIAQHKALLNSGMDDILDVATRNLHHMISYLKYCIIDAPEFWKDSNDGIELYDINVIEAVYDKVLKFEEKWIEQAWGKKSKKEEK